MANAAHIKAVTFPAIRSSWNIFFKYLDSSWTLKMENYLITKRLGEGSFGEVSLCQDLRTNEKFAMKKVLVCTCVHGYTNPERELVLR